MVLDRILESNVTFTFFFVTVNVTFTIHLKSSKTYIKIQIFSNCLKCYVEYTPKWLVLYHYEKIRYIPTDVKKVVGQIWRFSDGIPTKTKNTISS